MRTIARVGAVLGLVVLGVAGYLRFRSPRLDGSWSEAGRQSAQIKMTLITDASGRVSGTGGMSGPNGAMPISITGHTTGRSVGLRWDYPNPNHDYVTFEGVLRDQNTLTGSVYLNSDSGARTLTFKRSTQ